MKIYNFAIPVKINFIVDESLIEIETIKDLENIQEEYDIDLSYIIDKCELIIINEELEDDFDEDDDYYTMPTEDLFQDIISENWDDIIQKLNKDFKLKDLEENQVKLLFDYIKKDFNVSSDGLEIVIKNIEITSYDVKKSEFIISIETEKELSDGEIELLINWLETVTTEEWGDEISTKDLSDIMGIYNKSVFFIPWSLKRDVKYVKNI